MAVLLLSLPLVLLLMMLMLVVWLLLLLSKGEVATALEADLTAVLRRIRLGAALDVGACVTLLLMVAADVMLRFSQHERCPCVTSQLCRRFSDR